MRSGSSTQREPIRFGLQHSSRDLYASRENTQSPVFFSLRNRDATMGVDTLAHEWLRVLLYAFPTLSLISPTLSRVRENGLSLILIAPHWQEITQLICSQLWPLPLRRDLLCREIFHPHQNGWHSGPGP
jgi:hypothetical protein